MRKSTIFASIVAALLIASASFPAYALTADDIQTQIKNLLSQIASLTAQLNALKAHEETGESSGTFAEAPHRVCGLVNRNLSQGAQGDDVQGLQEFLQSNGYLGATPTGYYGSLTSAAVAKWQASEGVSAVGSFGPMSRERLQAWCGFGDLQASPTRGDSPLTVHFSHVIGDGSADGYAIDFGDGTSGSLDVGCGILPNTAMQACPRSLTASHTYSANGTYTAVLTQWFSPCPENVEPRCLAPAYQKVIGKAVIVVGPQVCTQEYSPVCGAKPIVCITTPCNPIPTSYSNRCEMTADGATFLYGGRCLSSPPNPELTNPADDPLCKTWNDGCNTCSRSTPGSPAMCTMMACFPDHPYPTPQCKEYFGYSTTNKPPVINGFSGPTTLAVGATGTWTIAASDPENQSLSYSVSWGDTPVNFLGAAVPQASAFTQTTTFTHAYSAAGTYTVSVAVRDSSGQSAKTSTTVYVGSDTRLCNGCTAQNYAPVCGRPMDNCSFLGTCSQSAPRTYGNRAELDAAGATYLYEGSCTGSSVSGASCTTPWGNQTVQHNGLISSQPYFSDGSYPSSYAVPQKRCNNGSWLTCDYQGNNCR